MKELRTRDFKNQRKVNFKDYEIMLQLTIAVLVIVLNMIEIFILTVFKKARRRRTFEVLLLSLSCADLFFGVTVIIMSVSQARESPTITKNTHPLYLVCAMTSVFHIFWITLDRLLVLMLPFHFKILFQEKLFAKFKRIHVLVAASWLIPVLVSTAILMKGHLNKEGRIRHLINIGVVVCVLFANCFFIPAYIVLIVKLWVVQSQMNHGSNREMTDSDKPSFASTSLGEGPSELYSNSQKSRMGRITRKQQHVLLLALLTAVAFSGCTLPFAVEILKNNDKRAPFYSKIMLVVNSALNSIFYFGYWKLRLVLRRSRRVAPI